MTYFTERAALGRARDIEEITLDAWKGICAQIRVRVVNGSFGSSFPEECPDGQGIIGTNIALLRDAVAGYFPGLQWPLNSEEVPRGFVALDLIEFTYQNIGEPEAISFHQFYGHSHVVFNSGKAREEFIPRINDIFVRTGLGYELDKSGQVLRLAPPVLKEALSEREFHTGDEKLDAILSGARRKFLVPDPKVRQEAIEQLWDAWERIKTIEPERIRKRARPPY